jgi:MOSC domain-containing protein YiiM
VHVVSVNVARPGRVLLNGRTHRTAILKQPVDGPVELGELGLAGDQVGSAKHHGGPDQAVYLYGSDDYAWWSQELGRELAPGTFGENLTIDGLRSGELRIGDRLAIGGAVVLEATAPRIPCETLAGRMEDPRFVKRFARAGRPGIYVRVLRRGTVRAGDDVRLVPTAAETVGVLDLMALHYDRKAPAERLAAALAAPVAERARRDLQERYDRLTRHAAAR